MSLSPAENNQSQKLQEKQPINGIWRKLFYPKGVNKFYIGPVVLLLLILNQAQSHAGYCSNAITCPQGWVKVCQAGGYNTCEPPAKSPNSNANVGVQTNATPTIKPYNTLVYIYQSSNAQNLQLATQTTDYVTALGRNTPIIEIQPGGSFIFPNLTGVSPISKTCYILAPLDITRANSSVVMLSGYNAQKTLTILPLAENAFEEICVPSGSGTGTVTSYLVKNVSGLPIAVYQMMTYHPFGY
jgi:hypothetical protein